MENGSYANRGDIQVQGKPEGQAIPPPTTEIAGVFYAIRNIVTVLAVDTNRHILATVASDYIVCPREGSSGSAHDPPTTRTVSAGNYIPYRPNNSKRTPVQIHYSKTSIGSYRAIRASSKQRVSSHSNASILYINHSLSVNIYRAVPNTYYYRLDNISEAHI